jgi:hypothetical protein
MAFTFNDMSFLTAPQRAAAQALADVGAQIAGRPGAPLEPIPGLTPPLTLSNTKRAAEIMRDLDALWYNARRGVQYSVMYYRHQAISDLDANNP